MQLPRGTLASSFRGPMALQKLNGLLVKENTSGYLRVSMFGKAAINECVVVYRSGRPVMAFVSDGALDHKDEGFHTIEELLRVEGSVIEVCKLADRQVDLLQELYREFAVAAPAPAPEATATPAAAPKVSVPRPVAPRPAPRDLPVVRGRFVRSEPARSVSEYLQRHPGETGHLVYTVDREGRAAEELHVILIKGRVDTAYNEKSIDPGLADTLHPGTAEFYLVDEALLASVLGRLGRKEEPLKPEMAREPARAEPRRQGTVPPAVGIPTRTLLEKAEKAAPPPEIEDIGRAMGEISKAMDDDLAMVRKVETDFANHVDDLLNKLDLSHLRARRKKR